MDTYSWKVLGLYLGFELCLTAGGGTIASSYAHQQKQE
jgi:hypothetical protein